MLFLQKYLLCKLSLRGDKCRGNLKKCNTFAKAYTCNACIGESNKQRAKLNVTKASGRHFTIRKTTKPKHRSPKLWRIIHPNPNPKRFMCNYCGKKGAC